MGIRFRCECGRQLEAPEGSEGRRARCPGCGEKVVVPGQSAVGAREDAPPSLPDKPGESEQGVRITQAPRRSSSWKAVLVGGVAAVVLVLVVHVLYSFGTDLSGGSFGFSSGDEVEDGPKRTEKATRPQTGESVRREERAAVEKDIGGSVEPVARPAPAPAIQEQPDPVEQAARRAFGAVQTAVQKENWSGLEEMLSGAARSRFSMAVRKGQYDMMMKHREAFERARRTGQRPDFGAITGVSRKEWSGMSGEERKAQMMQTPAVGAGLKAEFGVLGRGRIENCRVGVEDARVWFGADGRRWRAELVTDEDRWDVAAWRLEAPELEQVADLAEDERIGGVCILPDGLRAVTVSESVRLWDLDSGRLIRDLGRAYAFELDVPAVLDITAEGDRIVHLDDYRNTQVVEIESGEARLIGRDSCHSVSFLDGGRLLAMLGEQQRTVRVWSLSENDDSPPVQTGELELGLSPAKPLKTPQDRPPGRPAGPPGTFCYPTTASDRSGNYLAVSLGGKEIAIWNVQTRSRLRVLEVPAAVRSLCWSREGKYLAAGQDRDPGRVTVWEVADWSVATVINPPRRTHSTALSPDGRFLAAGQIGGTVHLYRVSDGELVAVALPKDAEKRAGGDLPHGVTFAPDGRLLAAAYLGKGVRVWKLDL